MPVYLVEQPDLFERDDPHQGRGLYQYTGADGKKHDYADNADRFIVFSRAIMEALPQLGTHFDILHCNDWQTGLIPCYLRELYARQSHRNARAYAGLHTLMTIHNIAYQGSFPESVMAAHRLAAPPVQPPPARVLRPAELPQGRHRFRRPDQHRQPAVCRGDPDAGVRLRPARAC